MQYNYNTYYNNTNKLFYCVALLNYAAIYIEQNTHKKKKRKIEINVKTQHDVIGIFYKTCARLYDVTYIFHVLFSLSVYCTYRYNIIVVGIKKKKNSFRSAVLC